MASLFPHNTLGHYASTEHPRRFGGIVYLNRRVELGDVGDCHRPRLPATLEEGKVAAAQAAATPIEPISGDRGGGKPLGTLLLLLLVLVLLVLLPLLLLVVLLVVVLLVLLLLLLLLLLTLPFLYLQPHKCVDEMCSHTDGVKLYPAIRVATPLTGTPTREVVAVHLCG